MVESGRGDGVRGSERLAISVSLIDNLFNVDVPPTEGVRSSSFFFLLI